MYDIKALYEAESVQDAVRLLQEHPDFRETPITWIEESEQPILADSYDYWRVPSIFMGDEKLFEANPADTYESLKAAFSKALAKSLDP